MVPHAIETLPGEILNVGNVRLLRSPMNIRVKAQVLVSPVGLRILIAPGFHFGRVDIDSVRLNVYPGAKLLQDFRVVVLADAGVITEIPAMDTADEIWTLDGTVSEEGTAMKTAPVENRDLVFVSNDD